MKKLIILSILLLALLTSCFMDSELFIKGENNDNTFFPAQVIGSTTLSDFTFLLFSDFHAGRAENDSGIYWYEGFTSWVEEYQSENGSFSFAANLGDIADSGKDGEYQTYSDWSQNLKSRGNLSTIMSVVGNHDLKESILDTKDWSKATGLDTYGSFICNGVEFYRLDSSRRTLGSQQLKKLTFALKSSSRPKVFLSHYPLSGASRIMFYFSLSDTAERSALLHLMIENQVFLWMAGHHHKGNDYYCFNSTCAQFISASLSGSTSYMEGPPTWYVCSFSADEMKMTIKGFIWDQASQRIIDGKTWTFIL